MSVDKDVLDTLTDEERAALDEAEHTQDELDAMKEIAGGEDEGEGDDGDGDVGAAPVEGKGAAVVHDDAGGENEGDGDDGGDSSESVPATPVKPAASNDDDGDEAVLPRYTASLPGDYDVQLKSVGDDLVALNEKLKDGNIEFAEFQAELAKINTRRDDLAAIKMKADIAAEMNEQSAQQEWNLSIRRFMRQAKNEESIDYLADDTKNRDLDAFVKILATDPTNNDKPMRWFLTEAHSMVKAKHGIGRVAAPTNDGKPPIRKPPLSAVPKSLAQVPGGDGPGDVSGEFANLDGLEGLELEDAIAKMTPAQRERWLQAA